MCSSERSSKCERCSSAEKRKNWRCHCDLLQRRLRSRRREIIPRSSRMASRSVNCSRRPGHLLFHGQRRNLHLSVRYRHIRFSDPPRGSRKGRPDSEYGMGAHRTVTDHCPGFLRRRGSSLLVTLRRLELHAASSQPTNIRLDFGRGAADPPCADFG